MRYSFLNHTHSPPPITRTESILITLLIGFGLWTCLTHLIIFLFNGHFTQLHYAIGLVLLATYPLYRVINHPALHSTTPPLPPSEPQPYDWHNFAIAIALVALYEFSNIYFPASRLHFFWGMTMLFLGRAWLLSRNQSGVTPTQMTTNRTETILYGVVILSAVLITLCAHRPDPDDQYYSNLAVMTLEHPERPLLSWNGMIWSENTITWFPVDRLPTYELLVAVLASWFNAEPIAISHMLLSPIFAAFTVLSQALLLRHLLPKYWLSALMVVIYLLLAIGGETRASFGIFAFVQLHFGKSILFSAILPLLFLFGLRFMQSGSPRDWLILLFGQIASLGFSSSALFMAPVASGLGMIANWKPEWHDTKRLLLGISSAIYPLAAGIMLMEVMHHALNATSWTPLPINNNFEKVFGSGTNLWLYLLTMIGSWTLMRDSKLRRTLLGLSFFFTGFFFNPFLYPILTQYLTGALTTWRLYFTMPLPAIASLLILAFSSTWNQKQHPPKPLILFISLILLLGLSLFSQWRAFWSLPFSLAFCAAIILLLTHLTPRFRPTLMLLIIIIILASLSHLFSYQMPKHTPIAPPHTLLHWPGIKADQPFFDIAQQTVNKAPANQSALVPQNISTWIPTLRHNPLLVATSASYLEQTKTWIKPDEIKQRVALFHYISGTKRINDAPQQLINALTTYKIGIVVVQQNNPWLDEINATMQATGFQKSQQDDFLFWVNPT